MTADTVANSASGNKNLIKKIGLLETPKNKLGYKA
jgi:hypothetical protein